MIKDLRYPLKQRPFPQRTLVLAVPRRVGLWVGLLDFEVQVGLDLDLDFYFESGGLWFGLGLEVQLGIGLWFAGGIFSVSWGARWNPPRSQVPSNVIKRAHPTRLGRPLGP